VVWGVGDQGFEGLAHFVGHFLGSAVIITTPNQGTGVASCFGLWPVSQAIFGLPLVGLSEGSTALAYPGAPGAKIGIIAGIGGFYPLNFISYLSLFHRAGEAHDGTVELANTRLDEAEHSIVIEAQHTLICDHDEVI
jgi:hypothetical protein